jgi:LDH2 family malate/lactate/ureidoglycolate dehydrogenase
VDIYMNIRDIRSACVELLTRHDVPADEATLLIESLIAADLKGVGSPGLQRLPIYINRIKAGLLKAKAAIVVERDAGSIAVLNGNFSVAQVIGYRAMDLAIDKAARHGIGAVLAVHSGHFGMASGYGIHAAMRKMIGIVTSNVTPLMPAPGGAAKLIGNNPFAMVAPTGSYPIVADMAMSNVAFGKLLVAKSRKEKIPIDWAVDKLGRTTNDPEQALGGMLLPMAGPKGYSLAVALEVLTGILGGSFAWNVSSLYDLTKAQSTSHMMLAINIESFLPFEQYLARVDEFRAGIKNSQRAEGTNEIFLPGEIELRRQEDALASGSMSLPDAVVAELHQLAREVGMEFVGPAGAS